MQEISTDAAAEDVQTKTVHHVTGLSTTFPVDIAAGSPVAVISEILATALKFALAKESGLAPPTLNPRALAKFGGSVGCPRPKERRRAGRGGKAAPLYPPRRATPRPQKFGSLENLQVRGGFSSAGTYKGGQRFVRCSDHMCVGAL